MRGFLYARYPCDPRALPELVENDPAPGWGIRESPKSDPHPHLDPHPHPGQRRVLFGVQVLCVCGGGGRGRVFLCAC